MALKKQIAVIFAVVMGFILFNYSIYSCFTLKYIDNSASLMKEHSIELDRYLPFDDNSRIVQSKSEFQLEGDLPVLDGATALFPIYSAFMNATYPSGSYEFDGEDFSTSSYLQKRGTGGAYQAIVDGSADIIFVAQPSGPQIQFAKNLGKELVYIPIGYESFVFIVNSKNYVESLTVEQIQGIYSGIYTNWSQLGGENRPINALQRVEGSGSQTAMVSFMGDIPMKKQMAKVQGQSIGYSFRFYVSDISGKENVKMLAVNNVYPSEENIRNRTYPITECFYAVYVADNQNANIERFIDWILSDEGQIIIKETGYVNLER